MCFAIANLNFDTSFFDRPCGGGKALFGNLLRVLYVSLFAFEDVEDYFVLRFGKIFPLAYMRVKLS